jgi:translation initiation factor IF-2
LATSATKVKRIHQLAKELNVDSKNIIEKCIAEGIPGIKDHLSPVKIGLEMTIREWFTRDANSSHNAVETADKVDPNASRKAGNRKKGKAGTPAEQAAEAAADQAEQAAAAAAAAPAVSAPAPVEPPPAPAAAPAVAPAPEPQPVVAQAPVPAPVVAPVEPVQQAPAVAPQAVTPPAPEPIKPVAPAPAPVAPAAQPQQAHRPSTAPVRPAPVAPPAPGRQGQAHVRPGQSSFAQPAAQAPTAPGAPRQAPGGPQHPPHTGTVARTEGPRPETKAAGTPNVPTRPTFVRPIGNQLDKPKEVTLKGPRLVRMEKPDVLNTPRPRRPMGGPGGPMGGGMGGNQMGGPGGPGGQPGGDVLRSRGPARGRGAGAPQPVVIEQETPGKGGPANKRKSINARRGRSAEALPVGPSKFSEQDLLELDARLNHATGFIKQRRRDLKKNDGAGAQLASPAVVGGRVEIAEPITIKALSLVTGMKAADIIKFLFKKNVMATINSAIANEAAIEVAMEYNIDLVVKEAQTAVDAVASEFDTRAELDVRPRPPVVTVMGHVDHGKTSLLDKIRKADVAAHEAGGITQHVGAYRVTVDGTDGVKKTVVFLDTPGHEAFTSMRARGAKITDLAVLVVAADDGVMPQTIESINHAKAAGVPVIVALNKIDKPEVTEANIRKIFGQLAEHGLNPSEWGGDTEVVRVSAQTGQGITELLEVLDYQAELLALKADYAGAARGLVIETQMQAGRGPVARILVEQGKLAVGNFIVIGRAYGRVRDMTNEYGKAIAEAGPSTPLEISGIDMIPDAGDKFYVTPSLQKAEEIATHAREQERHRELATQTKVTLDNFSEQLAAGGTKDLRIVVKADVQGSIVPLVDSLKKIGNAEVAVKVIHTAVGGITESDVLLADASDAIIIGFHVVATPAVREIAEARGVEIRNYRIIYEAVDEVRKSLEGLLEPERKEDELGRAEVREVFKISKVGNIAGCLVTNGSIQRTAKIRVLRDSQVVTENRNVEALKRVKDDAKEVRQGTECGIRIQGFDDLKPGDILVSYNTIIVPRKL